MHLQIDDLREHRQVWREWEEWQREQERYRREDWPGYRHEWTPRGVIETEITGEYE